MTAELLIKSLPAALVRFPGVELVYLFGSQVGGETGPMSDYDLAVLLDGAEDPFTVQAEFQHEMAVLLGTERVDVVILDRAPVELAYQIISTGRVLYQRDNFTRVEFEARTLSLYCDYLPYLRAYKNQILEGDEHGKRVQRYREALGRTRRTLGAARTASK
jgi:uncharacterized protein